MGDDSKGIQRALDSLCDEAQHLTQAATAGKLSTRGNEMSVPTEFRPIVAVDSTLDAVIGPLNVTANCVDAISRGDIPPKITDTYHGDFNTIKTNLNVLIDAMDRITLTAKEIAGGNVRVEVRERSDKDELMRALASMVHRLTEVVTDVKGSAANVSSGADQLRGAAEQLSQGTTEQASSIQEVSSSMEEMSAGVKRMQKIRWKPKSSR